MSRQRKVIELFNNLFASGFHLAESVDFLTRSRLLEERYTQVLADGLLAGKSFSDLLSDLQFSDNVVTQVSLSEVHGNMGMSLMKLQAYLTSIARVKRKLIEVATYPMLLLGFLVCILIGLKQYLIPQLEEGNMATWLIAHLPIVALSLGLVTLSAGLGLYQWYRKTSKIRAFRYLSRIPLFGSFIRSYCTAYYAREWGNLIGQGLDMSQIVAIMQRQRSRLFQEIGEDMAQALLAGIPFHRHIGSYSFFKPELSLMIEYGQAKSKLGSELSIYAEECWEDFFAKTNASMQVIQPLVFLFVALVIVLIYAAMLLPIYQNMEISL